jgi:hypothetical protein
MNAMIAGAYSAKRGRPISALGTVDAATEDRQERLNGLLAEAEDAKRAGDADALAFVEHKIDRLFDEGRAAHAAREQPRDPETGEFVSFDGGVSRRPFPGPGNRTPPSANELIAQAMSASRVERAGRGRPERLRLTIQG